MLIIFMGFGQIVRGWEKKGGRKPTNLMEFDQLVNESKRQKKNNQRKMEYVGRRACIL